MEEDDALFRQLSEKPGLQSKKWTMAIIGLACVMTTYAVAMTICVIKPEIAPHVVSLSTMVVTFLGSLVGAYTIGQSFVDWRTQASVATLAQTSQEYRHEELIQKSIEVRSRAKEPDFSLEVATETEDDDGP